MFKYFGDLAYGVAQNDTFGMCGIAMFGMIDFRPFSQVHRSTSTSLLVQACQAPHKHYKQLLPSDD